MRAIKPIKLYALHNYVLYKKRNRWGKMVIWMVRHHNLFGDVGCEQNPRTEWVVEAIKKEDLGGLSGSR